MDYIFEKSWNDTVSRISEGFGEKLDYAAILFLIGLQELGQTDRTFKKDEKLSLMHIAICTLLEPYGYYRFQGRDEEGWPHFERIEEIPALAPTDQELLIRKAI
ncbi:MAG: hypothetical protein SGI87_01275, partial [Flavobacteriales bacterium]|nr:hypothetical protein [Flavobacteriales bacterium]